MGLLHRARDAYYSEEAANNAWLRDIAVHTLRTTLDLPRDEYVQVETQNPDTSPAYAVLTVEGVKFRIEIAIDTETKGGSQSNSGMEFTATRTTVYLIRENSNAVPVTCLAHLGRLLKAERLDEEDIPVMDHNPDDAPDDQAAATA